MRVLSLSMAFSLLSSGVCLAPPVVPTPASDVSIGPQVRRASPRRTCDWCSQFGSSVYRFVFPETTTTTPAPVALLDRCAGLLTSAACALGSGVVPVMETVQNMPEAEQAGFLGALDHLSRVHSPASTTGSASPSTYLKGYADAGLIYYRGKTRGLSGSR